MPIGRYQRTKFKLFSDDHGIEALSSVALRRETWVPLPYLLILIFGARRTSGTSIEDDGRETSTHQKETGIEK